MDEKDLLEKMKRSAEKIETPESLSPENMRKKLEEEQKQQKSAEVQKGSALKRRKKLVRFAEAAAVLILVAAGGMKIGQMKQVNPEKNVSQEDTMAVNEATEEIAPEEIASAEDTETPKNTESAKDTETPKNTESAKDTGVTVAGSDEELLKKLQEIMEKYSFGRGNIGAVPLDSIMAEESADLMTLGESTSMIKTADNADDYSDTNLREMGVDEGDVIKTDGKYLYIIKDSKVLIVNVQEDDMKLESVIVPEDINEYVRDMYLEDDRLYLITTGSKSSLQEENADVYSVDHYYYCAVLTYDITNRGKPKFLGSVSQEGSYHTSRKNGNYIYMMTEYWPNIKETCKDSSILPVIDEEKMDVSDIYIPEAPEGTSYLVVTAIDLNKPDEIMEKKAIVSGVNNIYVSKENIYITNNQWLDDHNELQILKVSYKNGKICPEAAASVPGYLNDTFSLDEYQGYLRVLTTESRDTQTNNLFVLDDQMNLVSKLTDIAKGEVVKSARFMGNVGYFVTFRQRDPLFSVDLSDPKNPVILGELKIPGFSSYLHAYGDGKLLGVGFEADEETGIESGVKLSMFDVSDPANVKEVNKLVIDDASYLPAAYDYKAIMVNPEKNLIGFSCDEEYMVFRYDEKNGFENLLTYEMEDSYWYGQEETRGVYIQDKFYISGTDRICSFDMKNDFKMIDKMLVNVF